MSAIEMPDPEVILLAHMIGDGSCVKRQPIRYASIDEENLAAVTAAASHFGITAVRDSRSFFSDIEVPLSARKTCADSARPPSLQDPKVLVRLPDDSSGAWFVCTNSMYLESVFDGSELC
ncbi:hypothetical protein ACFYTS_16535 [Nocardia sp. NPDC004151]|uniref:hypothetical protein n=1 Tax=Nocardia sp. NPDC004151 TaxID=3364304 RepID=UPI00369D7DAA